ncbi:MAG: hypothetical protein H0X43_13300 [Nitrosospira sp.]|nr:hypothetical protein [Nitrosospira sp.]
MRQIQRVGEKLFREKLLMIMPPTLALSAHAGVPTLLSQQWLHPPMLSLLPRYVKR